MRKSNFALRVLPSLLDEARKAAEQEGIAVNQLINIALAEKISAMRTEEFFRERARRASRARTLAILARAGKGNPPIPGDELPSGWDAQRMKPGRPQKKRPSLRTHRARMSRGG